MAGPIKLDPFIIESNKSAKELLIKNTITDDSVLITPDGITNDSLAEASTNYNLLPEGAQTGLDATTTGVQYEGQTRQLLRGSTTNEERMAFLEVSTASSAGDETVSVELYDETADEVVASTDVMGGSPRVRSGDLSGPLVAGNEISIQFNVTSASGTAGATFDAVAARIIVL